jgi:hypothetical protein
VNRRQRARKWVHFWLDGYPYWVSDPGDKVACWILGHVPIPDQCCKPDHDFCAYCGKSMPGKAQ